ncbi:hypothetical protein EW026_g7709 [Hermanssonia centrifuga]|uniref:Retrotransposon gag domain-containing protein n=1 Tax=Hermanssonia centrifuga TaxID=98765 RepID=A0A4S4K8P2_9APHY|nr:hypothetical protein EW026_g7709 [Hermanssonia centrifuga]
MNIDDGLWKEVKYGKRAKSPKNGAEPLSAQRGDAATLDVSQRNTVEAAVSSMTAEQLNRFARRMNTVSFTGTLRKRSPSKEESTSKRQGKTVDPHNWGAVGIEQDELDPEYQRKALEFYSKFRTLHDKPLRSTSDSEAPDLHEQRSDPEPWEDLKQPEYHRTLDEHLAVPLEYEGVNRRDHEEVLAELAQLRELVSKLAVSTTDPRVHSASSAEAAAAASGLGETRAGKIKPNVVSFDSKGRTKALLLSENLRPINQVAPASYLGKAFANLGKLSSSAQMSAKPPRARLTDSNESSGALPYRNQVLDLKRRKKHTKKKSKTTTKRPSLKPQEPTSYDGRADVQDFHKFMRESIEYVTGYDLDEERYVSTLSSFMKGRAYRFFSMQVSTKDPGMWSLEKFFKELFDFCFPVDFRLKVRDSLRNRFQGRLTVQEYACELEELFMMAGVISDEEKVIKLWYGLHGYIQKELWRFELSPTLSPWNDVVAAATRFELAEAQDKVREALEMEMDLANAGLMVPILGTHRPAPYDDASETASNLSSLRGETSV